MKRRACPESNLDMLSVSIVIPQIGYPDDRKLQIFDRSHSDRLRSLSYNFDTEKLPEIKKIDPKTETIFSQKHEIDSHIPRCDNDRDNYLIAKVLDLLSHFSGSA
jgi:hypothetical protein